MREMDPTSSRATHSCQRIQGSVPTDSLQPLRRWPCWRCDVPTYTIQPKACRKPAPVGRPFPIAPGRVCRHHPFGPVGRSTTMWRGGPTRRSQPPCRLVVAPHPLRRPRHRQGLRTGHLPGSGGRPLLEGGLVCFRPGRTGSIRLRCSLSLGQHFALGRRRSCDRPKRRNGTTHGDTAGSGLTARPGRWPGRRAHGETRGIRSFPDEAGLRRRGGNAGKCIDSHEGPFAAAVPVERTE